jgi:DNA-binding transcriptional MerR regulator
MTEKEVAEYFGVSTKTIRRWRAGQLIQCIEPHPGSRSARYHRNHLKAFLRNSTSRAASEQSAQIETSSGGFESRRMDLGPHDDELSALQRAYEISQQVDSELPSKRAAKGRKK